MGGSSFLFQGMERWSGRYHISPHLFVASILALLTPVGLAAVLTAMVRPWGKAFFKQEEPSMRRKRFFSLLPVILPLSVFFCFSFIKPPKLHWTGPVWLSILPLLSHALVMSTRTVASGWYVIFSARVWKPTAVCLLLVYGGLMYFVLIGAPGFSRVLGIDKVPVAWEEIGDEFGTVEKQIEYQTGTIPLIVGMDLYQLSAQLSFYLPDTMSERVAGRHLFGKKSLMWNYWGSKKNETGQTILVIDYHPDSLSNGRLEQYFDKLGPIEYKDIRKNGKLSGRLYYRVGYGYRDTRSYKK